MGVGTGRKLKQAWRAVVSGETNCWCSRLTQVRGETLRRAPIGETGKYGAAVADVAWTA